mgnify:CR=1 FL=1
MQFLKNKINFKIILLTSFSLLMILIFMINSWLIDSLRISVRKTAASYQTFIQDIYDREDLSDYTFQLFQNFLNETDLPIVIKNIDNSIYIKSSHFYNKDDGSINNIILEMEKVFTPLPIKVFDQKGRIIINQKLYYGDTDMIKIIKWVPFVQLLVTVLLVIIIFIYYSSSRKSLQNALYVGIFKETAHQLGTPISSLLGWSENIKNKGFNEELAEYIDEDIQKLKDISERFSKIGSKVKLSKINLSQLLNNIVQYTKNRIPKTKEVQIVSDYKNDIYIKGDKILLSWAFENLIKNSIEAIDVDYGEIKIHVKQINSKTSILFIDTGKGVPRSDWKKIFYPGYSSKSRGWGVGLSLTKRIVEEIHSGKIFISSSSKKGTSVKILV